MAYDTKTVAELEELATNLRLEIALHPDCELELVELKECERWIELRRRELDTICGTRALAHDDGERLP